MDIWMFLLPAWHLDFIRLFLNTFLILPPPISHSLCLWTPSLIIISSILRLIWLQSEEYFASLSWIRRVEKDHCYLRQLLVFSWNKEIQTDHRVIIILSLPLGNHFFWCPLTLPVFVNLFSPRQSSWSFREYVPSLDDDEFAPHGSLPPSLFSHPPNQPKPSLVCSIQSWEMLISGGKGREELES